jgi:hypothetical protein
MLKFTKDAKKIGGRCVCNLQKMTIWLVLKYLFQRACEMEIQTRNGTTRTRGRGSNADSTRSDNKN